MPMMWVELDAAVSAAAQGRIHNAMAVASVFAAARARDEQWRSLRPADAPWPQRSLRYFDIRPLDEADGGVTPR